MFTVMVATSGSAAAQPFTNPPRSTPFPGLLAAPLLTTGIILLLLFVFSARRDLFLRPRRLAFASAFASLLLLAALTSAGCGGGSTATTIPPQIVTPQGTSTIIITPAAMSASGKPLQLQPIQLSLTVK